MPDVVYGASTADFTYDLEDIAGQTWPDGSQKRRLLQRGGVALTFWTAASGGTQLAPSSGAASTASGDIRVAVDFADVLEAPAAIWVDNGSGTRWRLERDLTATVADLQANFPQALIGMPNGLLGLGADALAVPAQLGSGTRDATTVLHGDRVYRVPAVAQSAVDDHVAAPDPHATQAHTDAWHEVVIRYNTATASWPTAASVPCNPAVDWVWRGPVGTAAPVGSGYMREGDIYEQIPAA